MNTVDSVREFCIAINDLRLETYEAFDVETDGVTEWTKGNFYPYIEKCHKLTDKFMVLEASYFTIANVLVNCIETVGDDEASAFYQKLLLKMDLLLLQTEQVLFYFTEGIDATIGEEGDVDGFH